ncbi:FKBP12-associated protein [Gamsiella multidivaricata]|nr:FKBP12-associated protein [Gamsiella multidivaricata]
MPNVPCYMTHPTCGKACGKILGCGQHKCIRSCHSGECTPPPVGTCSQQCSNFRKSCRHRCVLACHGQEPCPEDNPCQDLVVWSCKCGNLTKVVACHATAENPWDGKPRVIRCNDFCLTAERNKRLALALDIDDGINRRPRIPQYDDYVLDYAFVNMEFTLKIEKRLADWITDSSSQALNLPPMKGHHRKFVHELAGHYNVTSESVDVEPYRNVIIHRKLNTSAPALLASQACRQKRSVSTGASAISSGVGQLRKSSVNDPVNAIYLYDLVFGLTRNELAAQLAPIFGNIKYSIRWLTDDDAALVPHPGNMTMKEFEVVLAHLRTRIRSLAVNVHICERVELCWVNKEGEVVILSNVGGPHSKRLFDAAQKNQWLKTPTPAKVENAFALLDDDERIAAAKRAEEEQTLKAKETAGTLSLEAWEEDETNDLFSGNMCRHSRPSSAQDAYLSENPLSSSESLSLPRGTITAKAAVNVDQNVVDDWQELLDDDNEDQ